MRIYNTQIKTKFEDDFKKYSASEELSKLPFSFSTTSKHNRRYMIACPTLVCKAGVILVGECSVLSCENYSYIFDFHSSRRLRRERNFLPSG